MGGCVGAWTLECYPELFRKAVLSSPMLGLSFGKMPLSLAYAYASMKSIGEKGKEPLSPVTAFPVETYEESAANSEPRFRWYYHKKLSNAKLQTCAASARWGKEAIRACRHVTAKRELSKIHTPILLLQAEKDTFVKNAAQDAFAAAVPSCTIVKLPGQRHELFFNEGKTLQDYWERIFAFYAED